jgi:hypothetical protein
MPHQRDGQQLGVAAARHRARPGGNGDGTGTDRVIDQHVHVDEQILGWQHGKGPLQDKGLDTHLSFAEAPSRQGPPGPTHITRLRPDRLDRRDVVIEVDDRWDQLTYAMVWMTEPTVRLVHPRIVGGPLPLASGRNVWLTAGVEALPPCDPEPIPASSMAEPLWPEEHGVPCPGIVVRGVHLQLTDQRRQALDESA